MDLSAYPKYFLDLLSFPSDGYCGRLEHEADLHLLLSQE